MGPFLVRLPRRLAASSAAVLVCAAPLAALQGAPGAGEAPACEPTWLSTFGGAPGTNDQVEALRVFNDGSGPALYAAGEFTSAGGQSANHVAKWDGQGWSPLGSGTDLGVLALSVFDDGSGPALIAGGWFTTAGGQPASRIARWNGESWSPLGAGVGTAAFESVNALSVFDDGSGLALYAAGSFTSAGGQPASRIARWDGQAWSPVGTGMNFTVYALAVYDDGSGAGPALYAGGGFTLADGQPTNHIARWDGQSWSALASGTNLSVDALAVLDDGSGPGPVLCAGGHFTTAGGQVANRVAMWNGQTWSALSTGMNASVAALSVYDDGSGGGPALYAGGGFTAAGGVSTNGVARWDGQAWSALGTGVNQEVHSLVVLNEGSGGPPKLCVGGNFTLASGEGMDRVALWDGQDWSALGSGLNETVNALTVFNDGTEHGPSLFAGGSFTTAGGLAARRVARWDGEGWSTLGNGVNQPVHALAAFDDGSGAGPALYAAGEFTLAGGQAASRIASWDGTAWSPLSTGLNNIVRALAVYDDGSGAGPALYAAGQFTLAGGQAASRIARWDGQAWSAVGLGINGTVYALAVYDDGSGDALYAGGTFGSAGGAPATFIARWDGQSWGPLDIGTNFTVRALTVYDDGSGAGPALYAGGDFTSAGGQSAARVARWDGVSWTPLGSGLDKPVHALLAVGGGPDAGPGLYAGGAFSVAGGQSASGIARWNGLFWSTLSAGLESATVLSLSVYDDSLGGGPGLYAGGDLDYSPSGDSFLARWGCPTVVSLPGCLGNTARLEALSSAAVIGASFTVSLSTTQFAVGLALLYFGFDGTDGAGCGLFIPGMGELLLSLASGPHAVGTGHIGASGSVPFDLPVPGVPSLVGLEVGLQGFIIGLGVPGFPIEFSNSLLLSLLQ